MSVQDKIMATYMDTVKRPRAEALSPGEQLTAILNGKRRRKPKAPAAKRVGYREALDWIVQNDDIEFIREEEDNLSVTACMVRDLFDKTDEQVFADLRRALKKEGRI